MIAHMSADDFFKGIDSRIQAEKAAGKEKAEREQGRDEEVGRFVADVLPHLAEYKRRLEERGVRVDFEHWDDGFRFLMRYADGGQHGVELRPDPKVGRHAIYGSFTNDDGRDYRSLGTYASDFNVDRFIKNALEKEIEAFFFYAPRHGGYQRCG